jgi:hypothetical protein
LLDQANRFQDFSALMDSGIIPRVRELKAALGESIYHPGVLATLAPYNVAFGDRFHALVRGPPRKRSRISPSAWKNSAAASSASSTALKSPSSMWPL